MKKTFYIYALITPFNGQPFYIGKAKYTPGHGYLRFRRHISEARKWDESCHWGNTAKLFQIKQIIREGIEPEHEIIFETDVEGEAFEVEKQYIAFYGRRKFDQNGILTNLAPGGAGLESKMCFKEELNEKRRLRFLGEGNPTFGSPRDPNIKQK